MISLRKKERLASKNAGIKSIGLKKEFKTNYILYLFLLPAVIWVLVFCYLPMFGLVFAFIELDYSKGLFGSSWVGFKNFEYLFATPDAFIITRNTILYNVAFLLVNTFFSILIAIGMNELKSKKLKKTYQGIMFIPHFISMVTVGYIVYVFLSPQYGFINNGILAPLGIPAVEWYSVPKAWPFIIVFISAWQQIGYNSIIYMAAIAGIDAELYESALLDGAGKFKQAVYITLPCIKITVITLLIMAVGSLFNSDFGLFYYTTKDVGTLYPTTQVLSTYTYRVLRVLGDIGMSSAAGFYQSIVGFVLVIIANTVVKKVESDCAIF